MNNFSLIGKFYKFIVIDDLHVKLILTSASPYKKRILISVIASNEETIYKLKKGDLVGVKGFVDGNENSTQLISSNITWLPQ